jgi:regulatory protein
VSSRSRAAGTGRPDGDSGGRTETGDDLLADPEAVARLICLRLLTAAPRTRAQLAAELRRRRVPDYAAEAVLSRFAEVKLIDDAMFARAWVESRHHGRGLARRALAAELGQRGVPRGEISAAVEQLSPDTEMATARELVARKLASTRDLPGPARVRRLAGMLARKGYGPSLTYRVVREALERDGQNPDAAGLDDEESLGFGLEEDEAPGFGLEEDEAPRLADIVDEGQAKGEIASRAMRAADGR